MDAGVQSGLPRKYQSQSVRISQLAIRRVMHFGMELHAEIFPLHIAHRRKGTVSDFASAMNPSGMRVMRSPCDIQTCRESERAEGINGVDAARPYSRLADESTCPPRAWVRACIP